MTTNKAIIDKLLRYQTVMSWVRSLLSQALITKAEYAKIDTMMAKKYGVSAAPLCIRYVVQLGNRCVA